MPCDANYQCFTLNCGQDLICAEKTEESRFNGLLALILFAVSLILITAIGYVKLCRNRITGSYLRETFAGAVKNSGKNGLKRPSRLFEPADFTIRKKTTKQ